MKNTTGLLSCAPCLVFIFLNFYCFFPKFQHCEFFWLCFSCTIYSNFKIAGYGSCLYCVHLAGVLCMIYRNDILFLIIFILSWYSIFMWWIFVNVDQDSFLVSLFIALSFVVFMECSKGLWHTFFDILAHHPLPKPFIWTFSSLCLYCLSLQLSLGSISNGFVVSEGLCFGREHWLVMIKRDRTLYWLSFYCLLVPVILSACSM